MRLLSCFLMLFFVSNSALSQSRDKKGVLAEYFVGYHNLQSYFASCADVEKMALSCAPTRSYPSVQDLPYNYYAMHIDRYLCYDIYHISDLSPHGEGWTVAIDDSLAFSMLSGFDHAISNPLSSCDLLGISISQDEAESIVYQTLKLIYGGQSNDIKVVSVEYELLPEGIFGTASVDMLVDIPNENRVVEARKCLHYSIPFEGNIEVNECGVR